MIVRIEELIIEQQNKVLGKHRGGLIYGHDYNILKVILEHHKDKALVDIMIERLEDEILKNKVKTWKVTG